MKDLHLKYNFTTDRVNLLKAETDEYIEIEGLASTPDEDLQNEIIEQEGLDFSEIEYINADHGHEYEDKPGGRALARMGLIDQAKMTKNGLWIKGKLFKNHPETPIYINELKFGKPGLVQFSIEGSVVSRDPFEKNRVKRCKVRGVALTRNPVNMNTYARLVKSLTTSEQEDLTSEQNLDILKDRYEALVEGHKELTEKYYMIVKGYEKTLEENKQLKKAAVLNDKEKVFEMIKERIESNSEFREKFQKVITKALTPGGPQYATKTPGEITDGGVFMAESKEEDEKKKKMKKTAPYVQDME